MMATIHGPWWVCPPGTYTDSWEVEDSVGLTCKVYGEDDHARRTARLIAEVPDMLALLKDGTNLFLPSPDKIMSQDIAMPTAEAAAEWCRRASRLINHVDGSGT